MKKPFTIEINAEFQRALDIMEKSNQHIFITGKAGTGKSTLLDYFRNTTRKQVAVLAPTGVAALNVFGQTIPPSAALNRTSLWIKSKSFPRRALPSTENSTLS